MDTTSYWIDSAPLPRFPKLDRDLKVDVAIIGGGITGITAAYLLKRAGHSVALIERARCASIDTGHTTGNALIQFAFVREMIGRYQSQALKIARRIGPASGILGYEVSSTLRHRQQVFTGERSHMLAVLPAILAATAIAGGRFPHRGLVPPDKHVEAGEFFDFVRREGITITT